MRIIGSIFLLRQTINRLRNAAQEHDVELPRQIGDIIAASAALYRLDRDTTAMPSIGPDEIGGGMSVGFSALLSDLAVVVAAAGYHNISVETQLRALLIVSVAMYDPTPRVSETIAQRAIAPVVKRQPVKAQRPAFDPAYYAAHAAAFKVAP